MVNGLQNLRSPNTKIEYTKFQLEEIAKCASDALYFIENYVYITNIDNGIVLFKLRPYQKKILKLFLYPEEGKRHLIIRAGRQSGKTQVMAVLILWHILFNSDKTAAMLAHVQKTAYEIMTRIKTSYENLPLWLQQGILEYNKHSIVLENGSRAIAGTTAKSSLSGFTVSLLILDELAKVEAHKAQEFLDSVLPTIASALTSRIIVASTPLGIANSFAQMWQKSEEGNEFSRIWIKWWEIPGRDQKFKKLIIKNNDVRHWNQEYAANFSGSSTTLVDSEFIDSIKIKDPISYMFNDEMLIYEKPVKGAIYIMGVDTAKGTMYDSSCVQVLKINGTFDIVQVAMFNSNTTSIPRFAQIVIEISKYYNTAKLMIENNAEGSQLAGSVWYEFEYTEIVNVDRKAIGVRSTKKSKLIANITLKEYMERGHLKLCDKKTKDQLSKYTEQKNGAFSAGKNRSDNDDCVTALIWAVFYFTTKFVEFPGSEALEIHEIEDRNKIEDNYEPVMIVDSFGMDDETERFLRGQF